MSETTHALLESPGGLPPGHVEWVERLVEVKGKVRKECRPTGIKAA